MQNALQGKRVLVVGGSSGMGRATARLALESGAAVHIASRSADKLAVTRAELAELGEVHAHQVDMTDDASVAAVMDEVPDSGLDHLVISASSAVHGPFAEAALEDVQRMFASKFFGPYRVAKAALPKMTEKASYTFYSGVLSRKPGVNCSGLGAVNAAVEGLTRALALELGPCIRVNCVSPGMVRTEAYAAIPGGKREAMYSATGRSLPVGRVGEATEVAEATLFLMTNGYTTGVVLDVDGGHLVRQYGLRNDESPGEA